MATATLTLGSQNRWLADGTTTDWNFNFAGGYISTDHVFAYSMSNDTIPVRHDYVVTSGSFVSQYVLRITPAVPNGHTIVIYRDSRNNGLPLADFVDGGGINETDLDAIARQAIFVNQETLDSATTQFQTSQPALFDQFAQATLDQVDTVVGPVVSGLAAEVAARTAFQNDLASNATGLGASWVGLDSFGTVADLAVWSRKWVNPLDPRFGGIVGGSWHTAINAAATYAGANGLGLRLLPQSGGYPVTDTVTIPTTVTAFDMMGTSLRYSGTRDRPILVLGASGSSITNAWYYGLDARATVGDWTNTGFVAIRAYNVSRSRIDIRKAEGCYVGFDAFCDSSNGWAYNHVDVGTLLDNSREMRLTSTGASCFINENTFYSGRYGNSSASAARGTGYGVEITSTDGLYVSHNNNRWVCPTFEVDPTNINIVRIPFYFNGAGANCKVIAARHEASGGVFALCDSLGRSGAATQNEFDVTYVGGTFTVNAITQQNGAVGNVYRGFTPGAKVTGGYVTPDLAACLKPNAANAMYLLGPWSYYTNGSATLRKVTDPTVEATRTGVRISTAASVVGVEVDTSRIKQWLIRIKAKTNTRNGRAVIRVWDATDTQLTPTPTAWAPSTVYTIGQTVSNGGNSYMATSASGTSASSGGPTGVGTAIVDGTVTWRYLLYVASVTHNGTAAALSTTANFGGAWQSASDGSGTDRVLIVLVDSAATRMHVGCAGGSNPSLPEAIELEPLPVDGDAQAAIRVFCSLGEERMGLSTAIPSGYTSCGWVRRGEVIGHFTAAVAAAAGWVPVTAGASGTVLGNAPAWVTATAYTQYQIRSNAGNLYEAQGDGTSGATAPTGTGTVSDGTVSWKFVGTVAAYGTLPNLA